MGRRFSPATITLAVILVFSQLAVAQEEKSRQPQPITISELKQKLDHGDKFLLIDVRPDRALKQEGAIPGAIHIPVAELDKRMKDIPKDVEIVFYSLAGERSAMVAEKFIKAGYQSVRFCGFEDWKKANQKVVDKIDRPAEGPIRPRP